MKRTKPYTAYELFEEIINKIETPDWIEYALASNHSYNEASHIQLKYYEFEIITTTKYGGSEGVYTDVYITGNYMGPDDDFLDKKPVHIGTVKTLEKGPEAVRKMYGFAADIYIAGTDFVNRNLDDFTWAGYKLKLKPEDRFSFEFGSEESMRRRIDKMLEDGEDLSQAIITDLSTRKVFDSSKYIPSEPEPDNEPDL